jgi:integrase
MAILAECPRCHKKQSIRNKACKCGADLDQEKRRKKVFYHIVYRIDGKQVWRSLSSFEKVKPNSLKDAKLIEGSFRKAKKENRLDIFDIQPEATMTFKELSEWYLQQPKDRNKSLWRTRIALDKVNSSEIGGMIVKDIRREHLENYKAMRDAKPATVDQEIGAAKSVVNLAFDNDLVSSKTFKAFRGVRKALKAGSNARKGAISVEQYEALIEGCPKHISHVVAIGYHTGMRLGEILPLVWSKIDLKERFINLEASDTKEGLPKRVPISNALLTVLKSIPRHLHDPHVFLYKGKPARDIRTGLKKGCQKAGFQYGRYKDFTFHTLRHTFKTDCRRAGIGDNVSEAIMGHSDGNSMSKRYDDISDQDKLEAVEKLDLYRQNVRQNVSFGVNG